MRAGSAKRWASLCIGSASPPNTASGCSAISCANTPRAARRIRMCSAIAKSNSASAWITCSAWAPPGSPPATMRRCATARRVRELLQAADAAKDQSYFLHGVAAAALAKTLFPIGELRKTQVRRLAHAAGLPVYDKPDSTGICFIGERPFQEFLSRYLRTDAGTDRDRRRARSSASIAASRFTLWGSARACAWAGARAPPPRPGTSPTKTPRATRSSWFRIKTIRCCCPMPSMWSRCIGSTAGAAAADAARLHREDPLSAERPGVLRRAAARGSPWRVTLARARARGDARASTRCSTAASAVSAAASSRGASTQRPRAAARTNRLIILFFRWRGHDG